MKKSSRTAHNLKIAKVINILSSYLVEGIDYIDVTVEGNLTLRFKPSQFDPSPEEDDGVEDINDLIV